MDNLGRNFLKNRVVSKKISFFEFKNKKVKPIGINVKGTWLCLQNELAQIKKQGFGTIVNVASVLGTVGIAGFSSYVTSTHVEENYKR